MYTQVLSSLFALCTVQVLAQPPLDFSLASWMWTGEETNGVTAPVGSRAFRLKVPPFPDPDILGKMIIDADNGYTLYLNGVQIGSGLDFQAYANTRTAQEYCFRIPPSEYVLAINATNANSGGLNPAAFIETFQITSHKGVTITAGSDEVWSTTNGVPVGFQNLEFDDSAWWPATVQGSYGDRPWGNISIPASALNTPPLFNANWIWTNEIQNGQAPIGPRSFRKNIILPSGKAATSLTIHIAVDDQFTLYVQGKLVGSGVDAWSRPQRYVVDLDSPTSQILIAIVAVNTNGAAGVLAAIDFTMQDYSCGSVKPTVTDGTWKYNTGVLVGFLAPGFDDSAWPAAVVEGKYGMAPWGNIPVEVYYGGFSYASPPLAGAPVAAPAKVA